MCYYCMNDGFGTDFDYLFLFDIDPFDWAADL